MIRLAGLGNLDDVDEMSRILDGLPFGRGHLSVLRAAYRWYCRVHRLPEPRFLRRLDRRREVRLPSDEVLRLSLTIPKWRVWRAYLRLLYETGARPSEALRLRVRDLSTTMIYLHVQPLETPRYYDVVHLSLQEADEIARLLGEGWEVALQTQDHVWLRRRRWP